MDEGVGGQLAINKRQLKKLLLFSHYRNELIRPLVRLTHKAMHHTSGVRALNQNDKLGVKWLKSEMKYKLAKEEYGRKKKKRK